MSTWESFQCPNCTESFEVRIDLSIDRRMIVGCPKCGREQPIEIKDGRIQSSHED